MKCGSPSKARCRADNKECSRSSKRYQGLAPGKHFESLAKVGGAFVFARREGKKLAAWYCSSDMHEIPLRRANTPDLRRIGIHPDSWYPLAKSSELKTGKTLAVTFAGEPIVLARTESGRLFALENRCAHRQVPL